MIRNRKLATAAIWSVTAGFTALYISLLFNNNLWTDEAFTMQLLRGNLREILMGTAMDVHPPLYYLYAKGFALLFGNSLLVQKAAAILPMTATLVLGATLIRREFGDRVSFLFVLFLTCIPCSMEFAVQVRMYSLSLFLVTVYGLFAFRVFREGGRLNLALFSGSGLLAAYTHYFALVSVGVITGLLLAAILLWKRERLAAWLAGAAGMILCYLPWLPCLISQIRNVEQGYWIPEITAEVVWSYFTWTFDLFLVPGTVFVFLVLLKGAGIYNLVRITLYRDRTDVYALFCMLTPALTTLFGMVVSQFGSPIYRDQYVFPALGMLALFFGLVMARASGKILLPVCLFLLFVGGVQYKECYAQEYTESLLTRTEAFFAQNLEEDDYILYNWKDYRFVYVYYFPEDQLCYMEDFDFSREFGSVWFLQTDLLPGLDESLLEENGLVSEDMGRYGIEHNEFEIRRITR